MRKKNNLALYTLLIAGLFSLLTINISAQDKISGKTNDVNKPCSGEKFVMPTSISVGNEIFSDYLKVATLPRDKRGEVFRNFSNEQKANFIKANLALQLVKHPDMASEQKEFVLDAISKVSADLYDKSDPEKVRRSQQNGIEIESRALGLFSQKDLGNFIEPLMASKDEEVALLQKYEDLLKNGSKARMRIAKNLPLNDRVNIWKVQLAYHLATGRLSKGQNEFILEMLTSLSPETFNSRANLTEEEMSKADEELLSQILGVFTKEEAFAIFMTIGIQKYVKDKPIDTSNLAPAICDCNWSCPGSQSCGGPNGCMSSDIGDCGPFGLTRCHYLCVSQ